MNETGLEVRFGVDADEYLTKLSLMERMMERSVNLRIEKAWAAQDRIERHLCVVTPEADERLRLGQRLIEALLAA